MHDGLYSLGLYLILGSVVRHHWIASVVIAFCLVLLGGTALADDGLVCLSGSGVWRTVGDAPVIDGVLCSTGAGNDLYRIHFADKSVHFAPAIPGISGELRYLYSASKVLFYADDFSVYALEREHLKVIWHQPWAGAIMMPQDPFDPMHIAIWSKTQDGSALHLVRIGAKIEEEMTAELGPEMPQQIVWQSKRLAVIESKRMLYWPRPGIPLPPTSHRDTPETPADWNHPPRVVNVLDPEGDAVLRQGDYRLDESGLMIYRRAHKRISFFRFYEGTWTMNRLNSSATVQAIGGCDELAVGVVKDYNTVKLITKFGLYLQKRFELKFWPLPNPLEKNVILVQPGIVALDGGNENRILALDTNAPTWNRTTQIALDNPGSMVELRGHVLMTAHAEGNDALVRWNVRNGNRLGSLSAQKLRDIDFGHILKAFTVYDFDRYKLIVNEHDQFVIYDVKSGEVTGLYPFESTPWSELPRAIQPFPGGFAVHVPNSAVWDIFSEKDGRLPSLDASQLQNVQQFGELQTAQEKWYGYCLDAENCFIPTANPPEQERQAPAVSVLEDAGSHAPTAIPWALALFSLLAIFGVMLWRHGFGRKSLLVKNESSEEDSLATTDIFDSHNRRYISDRDNRYFLATHFVSTPLFRVCLSLVLGAGVGVLVALPYLYDDVVSTFLSWVVVLGLPVAAVTWIATSWTYWNRYYLLRFGILTEGKWLKCAQTNPTIVYEPEPGKTFELSRSQWRRVDFVPMVFFDPARPEFAMQYTGGCSHTVQQPGKLDATPKPACAFDIARLAAVALVLAGVIAATQYLYREAFPNPLSAWMLESIQPAQGETFTTACLAKCAESDDACHEQCHHRQLRIVLENAGMSLENEPAITAAQFLDDLRKRVSDARATLLGDNLSCDDRLQAIRDVHAWPEEVSAAFWATYSHTPTFDVNELEPIYQGLAADLATLRALCDEYGTCAQNATECPAPPTCPGRISELKPAVCALQNAIELPARNAQEDSDADESIAQ